MNSKNFRKRAYKGILYGLLIDFIKTLKIGIIVTLALFLLNIIMAITFVSNTKNAAQNSGILSTGLISMGITFIIFVLVSISKEEMLSKFSFPLNRSIFAVSNFIIHIAGSFIILTVLVIITPIETIIFKIISSFNSNFIFVSSITFDGFITGFFASWLYLMLIASIIYFIFMYIKMYALPSLLFLSLILFITINFGFIKNIADFIFNENNIIIFAVKLMGISIASHILAYIPLKQMEVVK